MFTGFKPFSITTSGTTINGVEGGNGPPLLLLHGYPQTHVMWHKVAPLLVDHFTLVIADLRGYGASGKPPTDSRHAPYSKRAMALDMHEVMTHMGYREYQVIGHDRGGRVAHRLALDCAEQVKAIMVLDIAPTREMYLNTTDAFARAYWHWFLLIQPYPFPEQMIAADSEAFWRHKCGAGSAGLSPFTSEALACYLSAFADPDVIHSSCEDYRAAASIDLEHDEDDIANNRQVMCPLRVLWGSNGVIERCFDPIALWRQRAQFVTGRALPGGHFLAEELPETIAEECLDFFYT